MELKPAQMISEYSRMLSQLLCDVMEHNYLMNETSYQLTKTQFSILKILNTSGSFLGSELSKILNISRPAISKNIDKNFLQKTIFYSPVNSFEKILLRTTLITP